MPKRKEINNSGVRWINPFQYSKVIKKNPTTIRDAINKERLDGVKAPFDFIDDPNKPGRYLIKCNDNEEDENRKTHLEELKNLANVNVRIDQEKLKKLEIHNKKEEGLYVDKAKFNKEFFVFLRSARDKFLNFGPKLRAKIKLMSPHEAEQYYIEETKRILNELAEFPYYDKNNI